MHSILNELKIILVEDSRSFAAGLKSILMGYGLQFEIFATARLAIEYLKSNPVDLIVTDLEMPEMDGFEFIKILRIDDALNEVPILVLTGNDRSEIMQRAINLGADAFTLKNTVRETFVPQLMALARLRSTYQKATAAKQLEAVQSLIGTYKHEFGNVLTIADGKLNKLLRTHPELLTDDSVLAIQRSLVRFSETLTKLSSLRSYEREQYVSGSKILKVG